MNIPLRVRHLVDTHQTRDPVRLAEYLGITVLYMDLGSIKGYYKKCLGNKFIVINDNIDDFSQVVVAAHELGHAILHSTQDIGLLLDSFLLPDKNKFEHQANCFAAELLINENIEFSGPRRPTDTLGEEVLAAIVALKHIKE